MLNSTLAGLVFGLTLAFAVNIGAFTIWQAIWIFIVSEVIIITALIYRSYRDAMDIARRVQAEQRAKTLGVVSDFQDFIEKMKTDSEGTSTADVTGDFQDGTAYFRYDPSSRRYFLEIVQGDPLETSLVFMTDAEARDFIQRCAEHLVDHPQKQ